MVQSKKGAGNLSRKLITILMMSVMASSGLATAQAPTGPNNVYIEQIGNQNVIAIQQIGSANQVGGTANNSLAVSTAAVGVPGGVTLLSPAAPSESNYGTIRGNQNTLTINQTGDGNSAQYNIKGNQNTYISNVTGDGNQTNLTIGVAGTPGLLTNNVKVNETILGNQNMILQNITGNNVTSTTNITGSNNQVTNSLLSPYGSVMNNIVGNYNITNSQQTDSAGASGHSLVMNTTGDYNSITTQQQGTIDTNVNIATMGNNNTITVRTSNAAIVNPVSAIQR